MKKSISNQQFQAISRTELSGINGGGSRQALPYCTSYCKRTPEGLTCGPVAYCECVGNTCVRF